jgi:hypothetical protein
VTLFDLVFLLAVLATLGTLVAASVLALAGRRSTSLRLLGGLAVSAAAYLVVGLAVALLAPPRMLSVGDPWCFDDWCLTVEKVATTSGTSGLAYDIDLRLSSRARRISQRARGAWVYLIDERGRRYPPDPDPSAVPLDVLLGPGESVNTSRTFHTPADARPVGLITGHGGPYCGPMDLLVIGAAGCVFHKPPMVRIR